MARNRDALLGSTVSFAHLIGNGVNAARRAKRADEQDDDRQDDENPGADDDDDDADAKGAKGKGAKEGDESEDGDCCEDEEDAAPKSRKKAKGKRADDDSDDPDGDEDDEADPQARAARKRERARCAAIFGSKSAGKRPDLAAHLAFNTGLPRREAIGLLKAAAAGDEPGKIVGLSSRMEAYGELRVSGSAPAPSRRQAVTSSWDAAAANAGIKSRR